MSNKSNNYILTLTCTDQPGIVHAVSGFIAEANGNIVESAQFSDKATNLFCMRIRFSVQDSEINSDRMDADFKEIGTQYDMNWRIHDCSLKPRVLIMVSRFDHCLADLLYRRNIGELSIDVLAVVSNHRDAYQLAASHDVPFQHVAVSPDSKQQAEDWLLNFVESENIDFVVLARYMQILSSRVCTALAGRVINIHHSFLPGFKGARPYTQAYERGVKIIGGNGPLRNRRFGRRAHH